MTTSSDLQISPISNSLSGKVIDVVISGSIGAVESVRFIRALRRLGATVKPFLTAGGQQFVTETALSWAADGKVVTNFSGTVPHISSADACVVAPASANIISAIAHGRTDSPGTAAIASHLGQQKPVILIPNMHDSLFASPAIKENLDKLARWLNVLGARQEEGKQKFPEPATLADEVSHIINRRSDDRSCSLITMGSTAGYIDAVRYVSNYSSGKLGSLIAEELYRQGHRTGVVAGRAQYVPHSASRLIRVETNDEMIEAIDHFRGEGIRSAVMAASVLDYIPAERFAGKLSSDQDRLTVAMKPTSKIITQVNPDTGIKVGFKLEYALDEARISAIVERYLKPCRLSMLVINQLSEVSERKHRAIVIERDPSSLLGFGRTVIESKEQLAIHIAGHVSRLEHP